MNSSRRLLLLRSGALLALALSACDTEPGGNDSGVETPGTTVTWNNRVGPLVLERCAACHQEGKNPLVLTSHAEFSALAELSYEKMAGSENAPYIMPPWPIPDSDSCAPPLPWQDDPRITPEELSDVRAWIDAGLPLGSGSEPLETPPPLGLIGDRTQALPSVDYTVPVRSGASADYTECFSLPLGNLEESGWLDALYFEDPGDMIHHIIVASDPSGSSASPDAPPDVASLCVPDALPDSQMLFTWISDNGPFVLPPDSGMFMPAGARLVLAIHYHTTDVEQYDGTRLIVRWTEEKPRYRAWMDRFGGADDGQGDWEPIGYRGGWADPPFSIPPDTADHYEQWNETWGEQDRRSDGQDEVDVAIWSVFPHMHYAGSDIKMLLKGADGSQSCLSHIEKFDFEWQATYPYDGAVGALPRLAPDDEIEIQCHYNNTMDNDRLRPALLEEGEEGTIEMSVGEGALKEMCVMHFGALVEEE